MKILVAGCAGFIGSHLTERLLNDGHEVVGLDNFSPFYARSIKEKNLANALSHNNFSFFELDILHGKSVLEQLPTSLDLIVNLASRAGVRPSIEEEEQYLDVNIKGNLNLLTYARKIQCTKYFFASSSSIYGNNADGKPSKENENSDKPISPYAFTKRAAELMNHYYHELYKMDVINARFFTVYGPRQRPDLAIHKFVNLIEEDKKIQIYGDGKTSRDYTFISDLIEGMTRGIDYLITNNRVFETINYGNSKPVQLNRLVKAIAAALGKKAKIEHIDFQEGDVNFTNADISKAVDLFGYDPQMSIEDGIAAFIRWHKNERS